MRAKYFMKSGWRYLFAAVGGILYFAGFVGFDQWYLSWFSLVPLFFALEDLSPKRGFFLGWFFGTVTLAGGFYWVAYTIHVFAYMPWIVSGLGCLLLCAAQGTEFALFALLYTWLRKKTAWSPAILGTAAFVAAEFVSPQLFPHYFGNSQYLQLPLIQISDITGVMGVTALLVFVNACIYIMIRDLIKERRLRWGVASGALAAVCIVLAYGYLRIPAVRAEMERSPKLRFGITQANLGIRQKEIDPATAIKIYQRQTEELKKTGIDIAVWPETAVQEPILSTRMKTMPKAVINDLDVPILTGALQWRPAPGGSYFLYNVAILADRGGKILGSYEKQKLLMLGEYIPLGKTFPIFYDWFPYIGRITPGNSNEPIRFQGYTLNVNICYEEILPRLINKMAAYSPNVLVNITNDNWFGDTHEPMQHLVLGAFRSVEHRLWLVRATNTGISAFVDATGRIVEQTPVMKEAIIAHEVPMMKGKTIYARFGDWLGWLAIILIAVPGLPALIRQARRISAL